jgi:hypothetical protein
MAYPTPYTEPGNNEWTGKGAVEDKQTSIDRSERPQPDALASQLGHRDEDAMLKDNDTDFPGPDAEAEHS